MDLCIAWVGANQLEVGQADAVALMCLGLWQ